MKRREFLSTTAAGIVGLLLPYPTEAGLVEADVVQIDIWSLPEVERYEHLLNAAYSAYKELIPINDIFTEFLKNLELIRLKAGMPTGSAEYEWFCEAREKYRIRTPCDTESGRFEVIGTYQNT